MRTTTAKTNGEILTPTERWAGLLIVAGMLLLSGFFALHQISNTGFFTDRFRTLEMVCLYGPIAVSLLAPIGRAISGRQNPSRPFEAATNLSLAVGSLWLWIVFPFSFAHLGDFLPTVFRLVTSLITNNIGRVVLFLQVIIGLVKTPLTIMKYISVRGQGVSA